MNDIKGRWSYYEISWSLEDNHELDRQTHLSFCINQIINFGEKIQENVLKKHSKHLRSTLVKGFLLTKFNKHIDEYYRQPRCGIMLSQPVPLDQLRLNGKFGPLYVPHSYQPLAAWKLRVEISALRRYLIVSMVVSLYQLRVNNEFTPLWESHTYTLCHI